jgi:hypothetical protein
MPEKISENDNSLVRETIRRFNILGSSSIPIKLKNNNHSTSSASRSTMSEYGLSPNEISTATIDLQSSEHQTKPSIPSTSHLMNEPIYASPVIINKQRQVPMNKNSDDVGLEVIESVQTHDTIECSSSIIEDYEESDIQHLPEDVYPPVPCSPPPPLPPIFAIPTLAQDSNSQSKRSLPLSNFLLEIGALIVVFILSMVLVLAIRDQTSLRITMQVDILIPN